MRRGLLVPFLLATAASAQVPARPGGAPTELTYRTSFVGDGRIREGGRDSGTVSEFHQDFRAETRRPLGDGRITFGAFYRRSDLGVGAAELIPDTLQLFRGAVGYERALSSDWQGAFQVAPSVSGDRVVDGRGFSVAGSFIATRTADPSRVLVAGLGIDPRGPIPVLPFFGAILKPDADWTFRLVLPELSAARRTGPALGGESQAKVALKWGGSGYRVSKTFGTARGRPDLDGRWLRQQALSAELGYGVKWGPVRAEVEAGWAFLRRFEYRDAGVRVTAQGAPVVGLSLNGRF